MSIDHSISSMEFSRRQDEWLDFDSMFQLPADYLDSNPTSVESISPRDLDQSFTDADFLNWESDQMFSQTMVPELAGLDAPVEVEGLEEMDFQSFINPNDVLQPMPSQLDFVDSGSKGGWLPEAQNFGPPSFWDMVESPSFKDMVECPSFRDMVESQASLDTRCFSQKVKRRDASIALHLQQMNAQLPEQNTPSLSSNHLSSPNWSESSLEPTAPSTSASQSPPASEAEPGTGMQLVLDLNMNTTTNVPKKQKPRSRAQRESYIKARKFGVCEKHRKQHKRCNCVEKAAAAQLNVSAPRSSAPTIAGLQTNHERMLVQKSPQRSVQSSAVATNTGVPRPLSQPVRPPRPDLSPTHPQASPIHDQHAVRRPVALQKPIASPTPLVQPSVSPTSHNRTSLPTHLFTGGVSWPDSGLQSRPARFRNKDSQDKQQSRLRLSLVLGDDQSRQRPHQSSDKQSVEPGRVNTLNAQNSRAECTTLIHRAGGIARATASGLFSVLQGAAALSPRTRSLLGQLAVFSSRIFARYRKGFGLV